MLPRHGTVYSVFLLTRTANIAPRRDVENWVGSARMHGSLLASAVDVSAYAERMLTGGLAWLDDRIFVLPKLTAAAETGGGAAMSEIARLLLTAHPPIWLYLAVSEKEVSREYIPSADLNALLWLEPNLDRILIAAHREVAFDRTTAMAKEIGDAAELLVLAAMRYCGQEPIHVAQLSDSYGYDIEIPGSAVDCVEVKAAGPRTAGQFHLSRNEFDTCERYGSRWRLIQLVFNSSAFTARVIGPAHVDSIREVLSSAWCDLVPPDTSAFVWEESAVITPPEGAWRDSDLVLDPDFGVPGFGAGHTAAG